jgi:N-glycosylase/DNA lyase
MAQVFLMLKGDYVETTQLPDPCEQVLPGIRWGRFEHFFTPAFWYTQVLSAEQRGFPEKPRLGHTLSEEVAACLLGGYGMRAELGLAAFRRLKEHGVFCKTPPPNRIVQLLKAPFQVGERAVRYRYPHQRGQYVSVALRKIADESPPEEDNAFRRWLLGFAGIGPKTASWITRNWLGSDCVAVIDVHVRRAGLLLGLFREDMQPSRHYFDMEEAFLEFATAIRVRASILDAVMWSHMRRMRHVALRAAAAGSPN